MAALAVEVNDVGLVALREGASFPFPESPGLALLDGGRLLVGMDAAEQARLKPRLVHDTFWDGLDTSPAGRPFPDGMRRADLAHAQLVAIRAAAGYEIDEAFLAVPGFWSADALGLLLSVARAAGLPVVGLVDAAVAAASLGHEGETLLHLDLTRHRACVTLLLRQRAEVARTRVVAVEGRGWATFEETWAGTVAAQFVRETRFDPRHAGPSEQSLHDALPGWLAELGLRQAVPAELRAGGRPHTIELTRASLVEAVAELYGGLAEQVSALRPAGEGASVLVTHRVARLPGLADRLREIRGLAVVELHSSAAVSGTLQHRERLRHGGDALPFVTRLPSGLTASGHRPALALASSASTPGRGHATHVLVDGTAHVIGPGLALGTSPPAGTRGLVLGGETAGVSRHHCTLSAVSGEAAVEDHSRTGTFVNGERVSARVALRAGDRLRLGNPGVELLLVAVEG